MSAAGDTRESLHCHRPWVEITSFSNNCLTVYGPGRNQIASESQPGSSAWDDQEARKPTRTNDRPHDDQALMGTVLPEHFWQDKHDGLRFMAAATGLNAEVHPGEK